MAVTGVSVYPAGSGSVSGSTATLTVSATSVVSATFNNEALGWVEVCKTPADVSTANQMLPRSPSPASTASFSTASR